MPARSQRESRGKAAAPAAATTISLADRMRRLFVIGEWIGQVMK